MIIPGILIAVLTFPGVIVHELSHQLFCRICRIPVYEVKYFQIANPCGYVLHEATDDPAKNFLISMGPFFINSIAGMLIALPAAIDFIYFGSLQTLQPVNLLLNLLLAWLGFSILMHAFPSKGDAESLTQTILKNPSISMPTKVIVAPFIGLVYVGSFGSIIWLDAVYAAAMAAVGPMLLMLFI
jgi:hypothetical protein